MVSKLHGIGSRNKPPTSPVCIGGTDVDIVESYKYLGVVLDNKLKWSTNMEAFYKMDLSRLDFPRRLRFYNVCNWMLQMFYQSVFAVVSWDAGIKAKDANRLNKLIKKVESVVGSKLVTLEEVAEDRMLAKLLVIMDNVSYLLHKILDKLTLIRQNIMTTCLILCWSPFCSQNTPDASRHGLH